MDDRSRKLRRQQLDGTLTRLNNMLPPRPRAGWVRAVRESLGMTLDTLGSRLGIGRSGMSKLETAEAKGAITLNRLRQAAEGLDCELVVLLVPKESLEGTVRRRARQSARRTLMPVRHSMVMESQPIKDAQMEAMVDELADDLIARADQSIWTEE